MPYQKMERPQQLPTLLDCLLEKISRVLVPLVFVKVFAMQENLKKSTRE
jgi:hypothetical protein